MVYSKTAAILFTFVGVAVFGSPNLANAKNDNNNCHHYGHISGAPGPIAGAGLPILAVGYGVYWLIRRRRGNAE